MRLFLYRRTAMSLAVLLIIPAVFAQVRLPQLISDGMVLQRDVPVNVWGWAAPAEKIKVEFNGKKYAAVAGPDSTWRVRLDATKAGGPYTMDIRAANHITLKDILVGDVWLCSGQSNMVHQMRLHSVRYADEVADAHYPEIRQFWVPTVNNLQGPQADLPGSHWKSANPKDVLDFSAVAYFFAKDLYAKYHVPIGIINSSVGGTPIEAWTSEGGFKDFPAIIKTIEKNKDTAYINGFSRRSVAEMSNLPKSNNNDKGLAGSNPWYSPTYTPAGWRQIGIPGYWEDQGVKNLDGVVWYRREIDVPASMTGKPAKVFLGRVVNADELYINGKEVGHTTYEYPQRRYTIPAELLKQGKNLFVVRVTNTAGKGGFVPDKPYCLIAGNDTVDLKGYWEYKVGEVFVATPRAGGSGFSAQNAPTALYNAMIAPLTPYAIKGFVWYQGEANANRGAEYAKLQPAMIADWRSQWKEGDIPFLYVQLPGFGDYNYLPAESNWAELREAQLQSLSVPHTGMAVGIDLGEWNDIHPDRKAPVGDRLALAAEKITYGEDIVYSGPVYKSSAISDDKIIVTFTQTGGGLMTMDGEDLQEFAVAGADKKFVWASAKIEGDKVIVWSNEIKDPKYVRYAWADNPVNPNLYNKEGLPASPFETEYLQPVTFTAQEDHDNMMGQLGIMELRPGPSGDANAPNHANYDEGTANPCPQLPDILMLKDGKKVTTPDMWWKLRRPEIVADLEREVYGRIPENIPKVTWTVKATDREFLEGIPVITKELTGHVDNSNYPLIDVDIRMVLVVPANVKGPVPVLMMFGRPSMSAPNPVAPRPGEISRTEELLRGGWGYATIDPGSIQADNGAGLTRGIIGLVNRGQPRKPEDWGALRAWAWGAARGLDYLETDSLVDARKAGIEGVSRYGKAALVTLAFEPRFAVGLIGSSGKGGATLLRRNYGEAVESLTGGEYYWMAGNFIKYGASKANFGSKTGCDFDVDSHELIALCAPRLTFVSYGIPEKGDAHWLDHEGSYMATIAAGAVFKLVGAKDLGVSNDYMKEKMPPVNTGLLDGELAWRQHDGGHTDAPNFKYFVPWASGKFHYVPKAADINRAEFESAASDSGGTVKLQVDLSHQSGKPLDPIWRYFGYDEANYTYMKDGQKLLTELADLSPLPVFIRTHNLLTTGDGVPALKWSSTNAYTEDAKGNPVYSWRITDSIFDTYIERKMKPLVEVGFMPEALSVQPESDKFQTTPDGKKVYHYTGWNYPPGDYEKFGNLVYEWVKHCISRYGKDEVNSWYWEIWNEPDISYWKGTVEEYIKLYDYSVYYIRKALPTARVGGPETTNPSSPRAAIFLKAFLDHISHGNSAVTGKPGVPMDFISFHAKGDPKLAGGEVWMNMGKQLENIDSGFEIVASYPSLRHLPIIIGESDPEGCAACSEDVFPSNAYRNNTMYACYTAASFARVYDLVQSRGVNLLGAVTWAFEFENQPWFRGFRDLSTNGVDKPVLNVFRMFGMMKGGRVPVKSTSTYDFQSIENSGVKGNSPDINGLATFDGKAAYILVWNYHDENDISVPASSVTLELEGLKTKQADLTWYVIDQEHSNSFTAWNKMGAPQQPTASQLAALEAAGQLQVLSPASTIPVDDGRVNLTFNLQRQGVTLLKISEKE